MKPRKSAAPLLAAFLMSATPLSAQDLKTFKPASAWALNYGDDYCRLMRDFKSGDEVVGVFLERTQPGPMFRLILVGNSIKLFRSAPDIGYRLHPSGAPRVAQKLRYQTADGQQYLNLGPTTFADMAPPAPGAPPMMPPPYTREGEGAAAAKVTGIALDRGLTNPILVETGALGEAARALQACADDLISSWGLDAEKHKSLIRVAMPAQPTAGLITSDAIPFADFAKLNGGNNEIRMMIDKTGSATSCHIHWPTLGEPTNKKICASLMEKGKFLPALDQSGQAIDSYWITSAFFLMPPFGGG